MPRPFPDAATESSAPTAMQIAVLPRMRPPSVERAIKRPRLVAALRSSRAPIVWVTAAAGAGKTVGVAKYLEARHGSSLWYEVDAEDRDPGTLVAQLGGALTPAPLHEPPRLAPVPASAVQSETTRLFFALLSGARESLWLGLDNFQEAEDSDGFLAAVAGLFAAWSAAMEGDSRIVVTSRHRPPSRFARLVTAGTLQILNPELLLLDLAETQKLVEQVVGRRPKSCQVRAEVVLEMSGGWAVAAASLARQQDSGIAASLPEHSPSRDLEDYVCSELLDKLGDQTRRALRVLACLPRVVPEHFETLGVALRFEDLCSELHRLGVPFGSDAGSSVRLHDLVRQRLRAEARHELGTEEQRETLFGLMCLMAREGQLQDAAVLGADLGAYEQLAGIVREHAGRLIADGRAVSVEFALSKLPEAYLVADPWLTFWSASCRMSRDPTTAGAGYRSAFDLFYTRNDVIGERLSAAAIVQTLVLEGNDLRAALPWAELLEKAAPVPLPLNIEATVCAARQMFWVHFELGGARADRATNAALKLVHEPIPLRDAVTSCGFALTFYQFAGRPDEAAAVFHSARELAARAPFDPVAQLAFLQAELIYRLSSLGDLDGALRACDAGLRLAETSGIVVWRGIVAQLGAMAALALDDAKALRRLRPVVERAVSASPSNLTRGCLDFLRAWACYQERDLDGALRYFRSSQYHATELGFPIAQVLSLVSQGQVLAELEHFEAARLAIGQARERAQAMEAPAVEATVAIGEALCQKLEWGDARARDALARALALARRVGLMGPVMPRRVLSGLVHAAIELGIETEYTLDLQARHRLQPPRTDLGPAWTWPLAIHTLGAFELRRQSASVTEHAAAPSLRLLKMLVAAAGEPISIERISAELWRGSTAARTAFDTALHRLRRFLGDDTFVRVETGSVSLDRDRIWVDAWALDELAKRLSGGFAYTPLEELARSEERLLHLYRGEFCEGDAAPLLERARLRYSRTFIRLALSLADRWEELGASERASRLLEVALEREELSEPLHQRLIALAAGRGEAAEATRAFNHCRSLFLSRLGVEPSPTTAAAATNVRKLHPRD